VDIVDAPSRRAMAERLARLIVVVMLVSMLPCDAVLIWALGFTMHPQRVGYALIFASGYTIINGASAWFIYRVRMKRARALT
jgi:hypothetical protein